MRAPREYRKWIAKLRRKHGKRNGVIPVCCLDHPLMERMLVKSKRAYVRAALDKWNPEAGPFKR